MQPVDLKMKQMTVTFHRLVHLVVLIVLTTVFAADCFEPNFVLQDAARQHRATSVEQTTF